MEDKILTAPVLARFWPKVDKTDYCWNWKASLVGEGYGGFTIARKTYVAHRVSYTIKHGAIPEGLVLDHLCRNRLCVNPEHLEVVTQRENTLRGIAPSAFNAVKTHCKRGHELTPENVYIPPSQPRYRVCLKCRDTVHQPNRYLNKTHCRAGHEFTEKNTRITGNGKICRACDAAYQRKRYWERKLTQQKEGA